MTLRSLVVFVAVASAACSDDPTQPEWVQPAASTWMAVSTSSGSVTALPTLGGSEAAVYAFNQRGEAGGHAQDAAGAWRPVVWRGTEIVDLGTRGSVTAMDNNGAVVVSYFERRVDPVSGYLRGTVQSYLLEGGVVTQLGAFGGYAATTMVAAMNDRGEVVGRSWLTTWGPERAFLWRDGTMHNLGTLGGSEYQSSEATDINGKGDVVGGSTSALGYQAFIWSDGLMTGLGMGGGIFSKATAVNDERVVVGYVRSSEGFDHPVLWQDGRVTHIGLPDGARMGAAVDINNHGEVLIWAYPVNGRELGYIWTSERGFTRLDGIAPPLMARFSKLNDARQLAGFLEGGGAGIAQMVVNRPPVAVAGGPYRGFEGAPIALQLAATDEDGDPLTLAWDLGDGTTGSGATPPASHTYAENGSYVITLTAADQSGESHPATTITEVANVTPELSGLAGPLDALPVGSGVSIGASYADPGVLDTHRATIDWNEGAAAEVMEVAGGALSASHTYGSAGVYRIRASVTDDDGATSPEQAYEYAVVYDPDAGFVTGGGWLDSPAGAYPADPTLTGKATFGFVSKYRKGATTPTGQFEFNAAGFTFHSTRYLWLVISGAGAQARGTGTVDGVGTYTFLLTALDGAMSGAGEPDRLHVRIADLEGRVIYDNVPGGSDKLDEASPQAIARGSIVIHR